jgi:DNA-directed RNA polymerase subunit RPC12/RpoP
MENKKLKSFKDNHFYKRICPNCGKKLGIIFICKRGENKTCPHCKSKIIRVYKRFMGGFIPLAVLIIGFKALEYLPKNGNQIYYLVAISVSLLFIAVPLMYSFKRKRLK